ncbi:MAG: hypothetical protein H0W86_12415, partial [Armatimonadetes bacterium]|nr:hypothetical protein [Armatimonadota bacterium]
MEQAYSVHIANVVRDAIANADNTAKHSHKFGELLLAAVRLAAEFHDLGKLDDINQEVLRTNCGKMIHHVDAGVAHIIDGPRTSVRAVAALAAFAHHNPGLPGIVDENEKGTGKVFRDSTPAPDGAVFREYTNRQLSGYRTRHQSCVANLPAVKQLEAKIPAPPLLLRLALSCLVDAD